MKMLLLLLHLDTLHHRLHRDTLEQHHRHRVTVHLLRGNSLRITLPVLLPLGSLQPINQQALLPLGSSQLIDLHQHQEAQAQEAQVREVQRVQRVQQVL